MGMYDSVMVPCPKCETEAEFQSKSGDCQMARHKLADCPDDVLMGANWDDCPTKCRKCGTYFDLDIHVSVTAEVVEKVVVHGKTCAKDWHNKHCWIYEHDRGDDGPYMDKDVRKCGRCHEPLPPLTREPT